MFSAKSSVINALTGVRHYEEETSLVYDVGCIAIASSEIAVVSIPNITIPGVKFWTVVN